MSTHLQTHSLNDGPCSTTTYTRSDLGIDTATIASTPDERWLARLLHGPEPRRRPGSLSSTP
jgi:hypothetical protein